jgi:hypothetical protein
MRGLYSVLSAGVSTVLGNILLALSVSGLILVALEVFMSVPQKDGLERQLLRIWNLLDDLKKDAVDRLASTLQGSNVDAFGRHALRGRVYVLGLSQSKRWGRIPIRAYVRDSPITYKSWDWLYFHPINSAIRHINARGS